MAFTRYQLVRRALRLWSNPLAPRALNRYNQRAWLAAVDRLGEDWVVLKKVYRQEKENKDEQL